MAPSPASELPDWALQLLLAVQQHEDEHADDQPCLAAALDAVPADITRYAALIDAHTRPLREQLEEARSWARHGYEIGQRSCTWSDYGVAPSWLTEGWPLRFETESVGDAMDAEPEEFLEPLPVSDDHPCAYPGCGHPRRAHITGPVWCRHCPAQTSDRARPGWHQYTPAKEQP